MLFRSCVVLGSADPSSPEGQGDPLCGGWRDLTGSTFGLKPQILSRDHDRGSEQLGPLPGDSTAVLMPGEGSGYSGGGVSLLRF